MTPPRRNIEFKARDPEPKRSLAVCSSVDAVDYGVLHQTDTYFSVATGRLKLREEARSSSLIYYERPDQAAARESQYRILRVSEPDQLKAVLSAALGIRVIVEKTRRLFLLDNIRIHLDTVTELGTFIEVEAVADERSDLSTERRCARDLQTAFGVEDADIVKQGYADLLLTPSSYRRHAGGCKRTGRCRCPYVVVWRDRGRQRKQMFATFELAREHRGKMASGVGPRQPRSSATVGDHYAAWLPSYRGRTSRGFEESTRREYEISFRLHILPFPLARLRMRDVTAPDVRDWLGEVERAGASPTVIRKAKVALSAMLACAVEDGDLGSNPAAGVRYIPTEQTKRHHPAIKRRQLVAADVVSILNAAPEQWRVFFMLLAQTGLRIGEVLGLTWENVHTGEDAHIMVVEQIYDGRRKKLKTDTSMARVPLSSTMASWLAELRPHDAGAGAPVFASTTGTALNYANVYNRVLRPALVDAGLAVKVGENAKGDPVWDYQGIAFHAFRKACGSLLLHHGKTLKQVQGWLRHSRLSTTLDVYIQQVDDGLGGAEAWDDILPGWGNNGAAQQPETVASGA